MSNEISGGAISSAGGFDQFHFRFGADLANAWNLAAIGDERVDLRKMADADRRRALEFRFVGNEDDVPRIGYDGLRHLHLTEVEIQQCAVMIDRGGADHRIVDLELAEEIYGCLADAAPIRAADDTTGNDNLYRRI